MITIAQKFTVEFLKKEQAAKNTSSFFFQSPPQLNFLPGQFMRLTLETLESDERANYRLFSIASSPTEKEYLMITTKSNHSVFKKTLFSLKIGTKAQISAPYGVFTLKPEETAPHVFLAGGIGITPFRSMIRYASDSNLNLPITLFTSFSTVEERVFQKELQAIAAKKSWLKLVETITQPLDSGKAWRGNVGRINAELIKKNVELLSSIFYIAGPPAMVDTMTNLVKSLGVEVARVRIEKFTGY